MDSPCARLIRANSTIRIAFLAGEADQHDQPICV